MNPLSPDHPIGRKYLPPSEMNYTIAMPCKKPLRCLLLVCIAVTLAGCGSFGALPSGTPPTEMTSTPEPASNSVHGSIYPVSIEVRVTVVDNASALDVEIPTLSSADLTREQRTLVVNAIEAEEPMTWSGQSNETPSSRIRTLVAATDRLPPMTVSRNPADAWRVARETAGYVTYRNTTYKLQMVKIAP